MEYLDPTLAVTLSTTRAVSSSLLRMIRLLGCVLLCSGLTSSLPLPFPAAPIVSPTPVIPGQFPFIPGTTPVPVPTPFAPATRPLVSGVNNPYYNYQGGPVVPILSYSNEHGLDGTYSFSFTTADGKQAQESGYLKDAYIDNAGEPQGTQVVQGSYSYVSPEGTPIQVTYIADENGFRPTGVHIPADGKAAPILPIGDKDKQIFDPTYNRYNPYYNRNRLNPFGPYNNRGYDPRYPYNPTRFNPGYNNFNRYQVPVKNKQNEDAKKGSA